MKIKNTLILISTFFFFACTSQSALRQETLAASDVDVQNGKCIAPQFTFAFPITKEVRGSATQISPSSPWHAESELPIVNEGSVWDYFELVRTTDRSDEIWFRRFITQGATVDPQYQILIYDTDTRQWKVLTNQDNDGREIVNVIFESKDGKIWGISHRAFGPVTRTLMLYNEKLEEFESVLDDTSVPIPTFAPAIDSDGRFWYIVYNNLYSFDPITKEVKNSELSIDNLPFGLSKSIAFAPDSGIYLMARAKPELFHYNPKTGELTTEFIPIVVKDVVPADNLEGVRDTVSLEWFFMDRSGRLWFHDYGWRESDGGWNRIVRSPVFIHHDSEAQIGYSWERPTAIFEDSESHLWFSAGNGLTSLDTQTGFWCHVTTASSKVGEDRHGNLWIVAYGKLYKYSLGKR